MSKHIEAKKEEIAKTVIMPGDPLRAKFIAETYLENPKLVNKVRGIYAYTGLYNNKEVTVMASGMGMPSIGIYAYELFNEYDVEEIIRIGSCGSHSKELHLREVLLVEESFSDSSFAYVQNGCKETSMYSDVELNNKIKKYAEEHSIPLHIGKIYSTDVFYTEKSTATELYENYQCLAVEMESFALFHLANVLKKRATCLLTVSDNLITNEALPSIERERSFKEMIELVLNSLFNA